MARTSNKKTLVPTESEFDEGRLEQAEKATQELARMNTEANENTQALAVQLGYEGSISPDVLEAGITESQGRVAFELFAIGARLLLLKEQCIHGEFAERCNRLGFEGSVARRLMQATLKLGKRATSHDLEKLGKSKLFELVVLDDEEINSITDGGSARGITLDDADRMSVSELRKAFREHKADAEATDRVLSDNQKTLTKLQKKLAGKQIDPQAEWSEAMRSLNAHVAAHRNTFIESIAALDVIREKVMEQQAEDGAEAALEMARGEIGRELLAAIVRAEEIVSAVRHKFDVTLGALIGE